MNLKSVRIIRLAFALMATSVPGVKAQTTSADAIVYGSTPGGLRAAISGPQADTRYACMGLPAGSRILFRVEKE